MEDVLGYEGRHSVVTGAASGMGAATTELLTALGARVTALDVQDVAAEVSGSHHLDLTDRGSIDAVVAQVEEPVDAIFSVAGLPGQPHSDLDTVAVNFIGARHLIESLVPRMRAGSAVVTVASNAGLGWQEELESLLPLVTTSGFDEAVEWCRAHPDAIASGYAPSKKLVNAWVAWRSATLLSEHGIRLNCSNPGPTETAMMPAFEDQVGPEFIDAFLGPSGRRSTAVEQAWPLLFLNSPRAAYISGEALHVDAGFLGAMTTGQLEA